MVRSSLKTRQQNLKKFNPEYDSVELSGESVFMGNLAPVDGKKVTGEVACIEPFISYCLESGEEFEWTYKFRIM